MVDRTYGNLDSKFVDNQDAHGQIENDETAEQSIVRIQSQLNKIPKFMSQI